MPFAERLRGAFSLRRNLRALFVPPAGHLRPLDGLRALSILWVVLFHAGWYAAFHIPPAMYGALLGRETRRERRRPFAHDDEVAGSDNGNCRLRENELRLAGTDQLDIDLGEEFSIEQRTMFDTVGIVDRIPRA